MSFIALILIGLAVGICSIILIVGPSDDDEGVHFPVFQEAGAAPAEKSNILAIIIFLLIFICFPILIIILARRNKDKKGSPTKRSGESAIFSASDDLDEIMETKESDNNETIDDNEDFNIEIK